MPKQPHVSRKSAVLKGHVIELIHDSRAGTADHRKSRREYHKLIPLRDIRRLDLEPSDLVTCGRLEIRDGGPDRASIPDDSPVELVELVELVEPVELVELVELVEPVEPVEPAVIRQTIRAGSLVMLVYRRDTGLRVEVFSVELDLGPLGVKFLLAGLKALAQR
jgi:hypothetical protein